VDGATGKNAGGLELSTALLLGVERTLAVDGVAESVDDTAEELRTDRDIDLRETISSCKASMTAVSSINLQFRRYA
jgi:hypothetical protein